MASAGEVNDSPPTPRPPIEEEITISSRYINMELTCPICLRILHKTEIVMECLHRFCSECIQKCLRVGKNECPSCRKHVPSRRSLRPDPNFDALIAKIYPDLEAFELYEERMIAAFNKSRADAPRHRPPLPAKRQRSATGSTARSAELTRVERRTRVDRNTPRASAPTTNLDPVTNGVTQPPPRRQKERQPNTVNFVLRVHPHETGVQALSREYLSTSDQLKIQHLKKFLGLKLDYSPVDDFEVLIAVENQCILLNDQLSLAQIVAQFSSEFEVEVVLHYRLARPTGV